MVVKRSRYQTLSLYQVASAKVSGPRKFHVLAKRPRYVTRHAYVRVLSDCTRYEVKNYFVALRRRYPLVR